MLRDVLLVALTLMPASFRVARARGARPASCPLPLLPAPPESPEPPPVPAAMAPPRREISADAAVARFCAWLRDWEFSGWHTADDMVAFYRWFCADEHLEEMHHDLLRELVAAAPGITRERRRLTATSEVAIVRIRRRHKDLKRMMLYRVASHEEIAERAAAAKVAAKKGIRPPRKQVQDTVSRPGSGHGASLRRAA